MSNIEKYNDNKPALLRVKEGVRLSQDNANNILEMLKYIIILIGLKSEITSDEIRVLVSFLRNQFKHRTAEEIRLAFELMVAGKLGLKSYKSLNAELFGEVLNAYDEYLSKDAEVQQFRKQLQKENEVKLSDAEKRKISLTSIQKMYEHYLNDRVTTAYELWAYYDTILELKKFTLTNSDKQELKTLYEAEKAKIKNRGMLEIFMSELKVEINESQLKKGCVVMWQFEKAKQNNLKTIL